jgi:hypothetical protein
MTDRPIPGVRRRNPVAGLYARLTALFLPPGRRTAKQTFQVRFLLGANLLGIAVAAFSLIPSLLGGQWLESGLIVGFAVVVAVQLLLLRCGVSLRVLVWAEMATVGCFLTSVCLVTSELEQSQLQWFLLLPLAALVLTDPERRGKGQFLPLRPVLLMTLVAVALGLAVTGLKTAGVSFGVPSGPPDLLTEAVNFLTFMLATGGLICLYDLAMRETVAELATLRRLLAVCAWCHLIRDERGEWVKLERYLGTHQTDLTHGICPSCLTDCMKEVT